MISTRALVLPPIRQFGGSNTAGAGARQRMLDEGVMRDANARSGKEGKGSGSPW
jgi:hypothetical protein